MENKLNIGLFGLGCVATGLYDIVRYNLVSQVVIKTICIKNSDKVRNVSDCILTTNRKDILEDSEITIIVELIDDANAAYEIVCEAMKRGKHVVTANKKMLAEHLDELIILSRENNVSLLYEASVCGSIPIIRNLEEYYSNDDLLSLVGICNGTVNYILSQTNLGLTFNEALIKSQELGFAERDPTMDIDGFDSKFKLLLLIKHAFGITLDPNQLFNSGIRHIKPEDLSYAAINGYRLKLFSRVQRIDKKIIGFVAPHFIPSNHFAYTVENEFNAIFIESLFLDKQLFIGKGAGSYPTAAAVLSDISALQFHYKYDYKKELIFSGNIFEEEFFVDIYLGSQNEWSLNKIVFEEEYTFLKSPTYSYKTGKVKFSDLAKLDFNNIPELFLAILPTSELELVNSEKNVSCKLETTLI